MSDTQQGQPGAQPAPLEKERHDSPLTAREQGAPAPERMTDAEEDAGLTTTDKPSQAEGERDRS